MAAYAEKRQRKLKPDVLKRSIDGYSIVRVVDLKIDQAGKKFAYCYRYLRPDQIGGSIRNYYRKEVVMKLPSRVDAFKLSLDCIKGICNVIDIDSYVKGRPKGIVEQDVYVCEYQISNDSSELTVIRNEGHYSYMFPNHVGNYFDMFETEFNPVRNYQVSNSIN